MSYRENNRSFYKSKAWNNVKNNVWLKQNLLCAKCNRPVYVSGISDYIPKENRIKGIVHHKIHLDGINVYDDTIALNEDNLEGLCIDCHNSIHNPITSTRDEYEFDEEGNLIKR